MIIRIAMTHAKLPPEILQLVCAPAATFYHSILNNGFT
jgi:hypothetical protein